MSPFPRLFSWKQHVTLKNPQESSSGQWNCWVADFSLAAQSVSMTSAVIWGIFFFRGGPLLMEQIIPSLTEFSQNQFQTRFQPIFYQLHDIFKSDFFPPPTRLSASRANLKFHCAHSNSDLIQTDWAVATVWLHLPRAPVMPQLSRFNTDYCWYPAETLLFSVLRVLFVQEATADTVGSRYKFGMKSKIKSFFFFILACGKDRFWISRNLERSIDQN